MPLDLANYEKMAREAVMAFWGNREAAQKKQGESGKADQGERAAVTAGKNMDGFAALIVKLVELNGLKDATVHQNRAMLTLPGYFRPTKLWDLLVMRGSTLVAAIELKSQVGPSFGNNFNNRTEEAIGTAHDFFVAYREGALGKQPRPFMGWIMLVEDAPEANRPIRDASPHFRLFKEFQDASYLQRYDILCQRLVLEKLYEAAALVAAPRKPKINGAYREISELSGLKNFVAQFAAHIAAEASRK